MNYCNDFNHARCRHESECIFVIVFFSFRQKYQSYRNVPVFVVKYIINEDEHYIALKFRHFYMNILYIYDNIDLYLF